MAIYTLGKVIIWVITMPAINRNTIQTKLIHELFELIKTSTSTQTKEIATDELLRRGYTLDDITLIANSDNQ